MRSNKVVIKIKMGLKGTKIKYSGKYFKNEREVIEKIIEYFKKALNHEVKDYVLV